MPTSWIVVRQGLDDEGADHRAGERERAAGERGAAEDDGEDRVELDDRPGVLASAAMMLELIIRPAMPAQQRR